MPNHIKKKKSGFDKAFFSQDNFIKVSVNFQDLLHPESKYSKTLRNRDVQEFRGIG